jgi:predicted cupin superfamily sugar epimerase
VSGRAAELVAQLGLEPHPEGGWYRSTWRDEPADGSRGEASSIHYLLEAGQRSHWHRIDATEVWLHHEGGRLELSIEGHDPVVLGPDHAAGQVLQAVVPPGAWQSARPLDEHVLVSCVVVPAFTFDTFELAPEGWSPGGDGDV